MKWRTFGKALALALIGQAVVRIVLTDATGSDLFRSIVALIFLLVLIDRTCALSRVITCHGSSHCASLEALVPLGP
jgi:hypothetical protein